MKMGEFLGLPLRWMNRPWLLASVTARLRQTGQFSRLWTTVEMWTRCEWADEGSTSYGRLAYNRAGTGEGKERP
jgi:hypothetical protein